MLQPVHLFGINLSHIDSVIEFLWLLHVVMKRNVIVEPLCHLFSFLSICLCHHKGITLRVGNFPE